MTAGARWRAGEHGVVAVVPVKDLDLAKSRLLLDPDRRAALALAVAQDVLAALLATPEVAHVVVVTGDPLVLAHARRAGASVVDDPGEGLDAAVAAGAVAAGAVAAAERCAACGLLVVPADLPCLRPADLAAVLRMARRLPGAVVPDRSGTGTTMLVHRGDAPVVTAYGPGSAARHAALGLTVLGGAPDRARLDVDTLEDLEAATVLGLGVHTACVVAGPLGLRRPRTPPTR